MFIPLYSLLFICYAFVSLRFLVSHLFCIQLSRPTFYLTLFSFFDTILLSFPFVCFHLGVSSLSAIFFPLPALQLPHAFFQHQPESGQCHGVTCNASGPGALLQSFLFFLRPTSSMVFHTSCRMPLVCCHTAAVLSTDWYPIQVARHHSFATTYSYWPGGFFFLHWAVKMERRSKRCRLAFAIHPASLHYAPSLGCFSLSGGFAWELHFLIFLPPWASTCRPWDVQMLTGLPSLVLLTEKVQPVHFPTLRQFSLIPNILTFTTSLPWLCSSSWIPTDAVYFYNVSSFSCFLLSSWYSRPLFLSHYFFSFLFLLLSFIPSWWGLG